MIGLDSGEEMIDVDVGWYGRVGQAPGDLIFASRLLFLSRRLNACLVSGEAWMSLVMACSFEGAGLRAWTVDGGRWTVWSMDNDQLLLPSNLGTRDGYAPCFM